MKKRLLKRVSAVALMVALAAGMTGCTGKGSAAPTAAGSITDGKTEKTVLNVWHQWSNDTNELKKKYDEAVSAYLAENPNI